MEEKLPLKITYWSNELQKDITYVRITKAEWELLPQEEREIFYNPKVGYLKDDIIWHAKLIK